MIATTYLDIEAIVKDWLKAGPVGAITQNIYQSMPSGSPVPSVTGRRIGGAPIRGYDIPAERARMSFSCWHTTRPNAYLLSAALITEIENLAQVGAYTNPAGRLEVGEVISWAWLPDPASNQPRYIVDALMVAIAV